MDDVIGRCTAASGVVIIYKYHTRGVPPLCFLSLAYSIQQPFNPKHSPCSWFSVFLFHILHCLSICIPLCEFLSFSARHWDMGLFAWISHFLFGVCIWSLVLVPSTHQTLKLLKIKERDRKEDTHRKVQKWENDDKSKCDWVKCMCSRESWWSSKENPDWWHRHTENQRKMKKRSGNYKVVNYCYIPRYGQKRPESNQPVSSYCKIVFHPNLISKKSGLFLFPITICFYIF